MLRPSSCSSWCLFSGSKETQAVKVAGFRCRIIRHPYRTCLRRLCQHNPELAFLPGQLAGMNPRGLTDLVDSLEPVDGLEYRIRRAARLLPGVQVSPWVQGRFPDGLRRPCRPSSLSARQRRAKAGRSKGRPRRRSRTRWLFPWRRRLRAVLRSGAGPGPGH